MAALNVRSVLVTGSNRGIGLELIKQLVGKSNQPEWTFATCRDPEGPRAQVLKNLAAKHQGLIIIQLDTTDPSSVKAAAAKVTEHLKGAGLNLLINNAGIAKPRTLEAETSENMAEVYQTNVIGPMVVSQAFLPLLRKASQESPQKGMSCSKAAIVNISSEAGSITNLLLWESAQAISYCCSKAALNNLTKCQSLGFAEDGILSIALHPGVVQTDMTSPRTQAGERAMAALNVRSILVTGSNRGIGLELIKQLAGRNNQPEWIFATCRDPEGPRAQVLRNLADKYQGVKIVRLDAADPSSVKAAAARVTEQLKGTGLNLLINNAGIVKATSLETETPEYMSEVYQTNVIGPMVVSQAFLPLLRKASQESPQKGMSCSKAAIVNVSSEAGSITNLLAWEYGHVISYRCSKASLNILTRCQALGFAKDGIMSIALHPGWVQTDMTSPDAPLPVDVSVRETLNTLSRLSEKDSGTFVNWEGKAVPW
ncbi:hypothetical protein lerEdw1_000957 [Lerista edwardsae]|nr:hypothetical protein lerEdw1_000957 [Lerista edwardsae]